MKKFSKLIAVVLAIAVIICPMMSVVSHATTTNGYKIEANPNDANELMLTISSTDGFVAYDATVTFNSTDAFQDDCNTGDYVDGLRLISYEVDGGEGNSHNLPRIYSSMPNDTTLKMIVIKNDFSATGMYTELVIGIRVAAGSTATLTKIQAADEGTVADDPTLLTFPAANESTGEIDQTDEYAKENATITVHTHDLTLVPANDPTCTDDGNYAYYTCSGCDKIFSDSQGTNETTSQAVTRPATGHTWGEYVSNNDATCTADGTKKRTCSECGATETITDVGSALGHTPATAVVENNVPATCTTDGSYDSVVKCSVCKTELSRETVIVKATGHTPATAVEENRVEATCGVDGSYDSVVYCSVCHAEISREHHTIPATGAHKYTYTSNGDGTHTVGCENCDYSAQGTCDTEEDGACSKCGYKAATGPVESVLDANINVLNPQIQIQTSIDIIIRATKATTSGVAGAPYASSAVVFTPQKFNNMLMKYYADPTPVSLESYTSKNNAAIYYNVASYEINLPISYYVACYDDLGNEVAHSNTFTVTPSELLKSKYKANPATAVDTAMNRLVTDTLNLGYAAQMYFAPQVNGGANDLGQSDPINMDWPQEYASESVGDLSDVTNFDWNASSSITDSTNPLRLTADISGAPVIKFSILRGSSAGSSPLDYSKLTLQASYTTLYTQSGSPEIRSDTVTGSDWLKYVDGKNLRYNFTKAAMYDANKTVTFVLTYDGVEVCTCTYSMDSYISNSSNSVASALGKFNASARAYFEAQGYTV